jgi:hypothetical protein
MGYVYEKLCKKQSIYAIIPPGGSKMFAITGIIQGNTILTDYPSLEYYNGRKVIITVLEDDKPYHTVSDEKLFAISDSLIDQNKQAYQELAK